MIKPKLKIAYSNEYAILYPVDYMVLNNIYYYLVLIANIEGVIYDVILLPPDKFSITNHSLLIHHTDSEDEVFVAVP